MAKVKDAPVVVADTSTALSAGMEALLLADAGAGAENISMDECSLPILGMVQSGSKLRKQSEPCYNPDAKEGQIYDNVTYEAHDSILIAVAGFKKTYVEWTPGTKGTFVAEHKPSSDVVANATLVEAVEGGRTVRKLQTDLGNVLNETYTYIVAYKTADGEIKMGILPLKKTAIAIARKFNTMLTQTTVTIGASNKKIKPPTYAMQFEFSTAPKSNDQGDWFVPKVDYKGLIFDEEFLAAAKGLYDVVQTQDVVGVNTDDDLM